MAGLIGNAMKDPNYNFFKTPKNPFAPDPSTGLSSPKMMFGKTAAGDALTPAPNIYSAKPPANLFTGVPALMNSVPAPATPPVISSPTVEPPPVAEVPGVTGPPPAGPVGAPPPFQTGSMLGPNVPHFTGGLFPYGVNTDGTPYYPPGTSPENPRGPFSAGDVVNKSQAAGDVNPGRAAYVDAAIGAAPRPDASTGLGYTQGLAPTLPPAVEKPPIPVRPPAPRIVPGGGFGYTPPPPVPQVMNAPPAYVPPPPVPQVMTVPSPTAQPVVQATPSTPVAPVVAPTPVVAPASVVAQPSPVQALVAPVTAGPPVAPKARPIAPATPVNQGTNAGQFQGGRAPLVDVQQQAFRPWWSKQRRASGVY